MNSVKQHNRNQNNWLLEHDSLILVKGRVMLPFREGFFHEQNLNYKMSQKKSNKFLNLQ